MITVERIAELRAHLDGRRRVGESVGLVPTMGAFHAGHRSLMRRARRQCDVVVVSLFVNPLQFGPGEDLARYPRDAEGDAATAAEEGVDLLFAPPADEMYPRRPLTSVSVAGLSEGLCGEARPGHFTGVATVVAKLFAIAGPCRAYFGRKDAQQLAVVQRLAADLDLPVEVVPCPTVRHADGLALSSRNAYLGEEERRAARCLYRALEEAASAVSAGERDPEGLLGRTRLALLTHPAVRPEYVAVLRAGHLTPFSAGKPLTGEVLVALAARVGPARLIDNLTLEIDGPLVHADFGVREDELTCSGR